MDQPVKSVTITVDENEAKNLIQIIDIACKAAGLSVAGVAIGWHAKLNKAFNPDPVVLAQPEAPKSP